MADSSRQQFQIRPATLGDKLIWRYPLATAEGQQALEGLPDVESVTVGYYRVVTPPGAWAFFPVATRYARAALSVAAVQRRITTELAARITLPDERKGSTP